ncbi:MAG: nucleotidyl transferase AbiEii/AbiGii toxin family protein [Bacteroidales bacterium]|nr:nucleotidyl transferase AbiEii/AbiGii toxin family protein [Bacteroidales bacterium]
MILKKELIEIAKAKGVQTKTIDKDWILGHFLNAMFSFEEVQEKFVFKGGTCLKKCYIEDYRFSEDLDFTLLDETFEIDARFIRAIIGRAEETSGAKFSFEKQKLQKSNDIEQGYEISVKYWGADHKTYLEPLPPARWQTSIKLDISFSEKLLRPIVFNPIFHDFSDKDKIDQIVPTYSLTEILSEKLRSLIQRNRPRDIYDIWTLSNYFSEEQYLSIKELLHEKSNDKNIVVTGIEDFVDPIKGRKNKRAWHSSLADHLPEHKLPDFDEVYGAIKEFIEKIVNA